MQKQNSEIRPIEKNDLCLEDYLKALKQGCQCKDLVQEIASATLDIKQRLDRAMQLTKTARISLLHGTGGLDTFAFLSRILGKLTDSRRHARSAMFLLKEISGKSTKSRKARTK